MSLSLLQQTDLLLQGEFLALSLRHPQSLPYTQFLLSNNTLVTILDTGVISFEPELFFNKDIVLSCGVHGNETAPIEICDAIVKDILLEKITLKHRLLVLFGNPPAINANKREITENLNRLFSGHHSLGDVPQNAERKRAQDLERFVTEFYQDKRVTNLGPRNRYLYDLHTAIRGSRFEKFAVYPYLHDKPWQKSEFEFLEKCGVTTVLLMKTPASTFSYYASNTHGAHAFTIELGKVRPFGENDMTSFSEIATTLRELISQKELNTPPFIEANFALYEVYRTINKKSELFKLNFADDVQNFTTFPVGYVLASDIAVQYKVEVKGEAIIFPNPKVAVGQRAMLMVIPTTVSHHLA